MMATDILVEKFAVLWNSLQTSTLVQHLGARFRGLRHRDQIALRVLGVFLLCALIYLIILSPARQFAVQAQSSAERQRDTFDWMAANADQFRAQNSAERQWEEGQTLLGISSDLAQQWNMGFKRFEPVDDSSMRVWMEDVTFSNLIQWVAELNDDFDISVRELQIDRGPGNSLNANLTLQE